MELGEFEQEEVIEDEGGKEGKEGKRALPKKLIIFLFISPFILFVSVIVAVLGIKSGDEVKSEVVGLSQKKPLLRKSTVTDSASRKLHRKTPPSEPSHRIVVRVRLDKNPFKDFYERKYLARVKEEVKKKILREVQEKEKVERDRLLSELRKKLQMSSPAPRIDFRVKAIICSDRCYALTDKGVLGNGDLYKGKTLVITPSGVSLK